MSMPPLSTELQVRPAVGLFSYEASLISERFCEAYEKTAEINRQRLHQLDMILTEFESSGIEVLPLKGADLLARAYRGVLGLRPMVDIDLLFHRHDLPHIERILGANGFLPCVSGNACYVSPDRVLALDVISEIWYLKDIDAVWKRVVPRHVAGRTRPAMHPEDALIYLVAYQTIHRGWLSPQMALDVAAFLDAEGEFIDWRNVVEQVDSCHLNLPLYHGLAYAYEKGGAKIPLWVLETLQPPVSQRQIARLYQRLVTERPIPEFGLFFLVFSRPGFRNKFLGLWNTIFPSRDFLDLRYGKRSRWGRFWVRLTRPVYLSFRGGVLLFRIGWRLLLPFKEISAPGLPRGRLPATSVWSTSVQGETPFHPGTSVGPAPAQEAQGHQHKAEET